MSESSKETGRAASKRPQEVLEEEQEDVVDLQPSAKLAEKQSLEQDAEELTQALDTSFSNVSDFGEFQLASTEDVTGTGQGVDSAGDFVRFSRDSPAFRLRCSVAVA